MVQSSQGNFPTANQALYHTATSNIIDHALLLTRLQRSFGVEGGCLAWFTSYLSGRSYCMVINGVASHVIHNMCLVPQGSVLGQLLFILYTADLADIAAQYNVTLHAFADDNGC